MLSQELKVDSDLAEPCAHDEPKKSDKKTHRNFRWPVLGETFWTDLAPYTVVAFSVLVGDMSRGILFPVLWRRVLKLGGNKTMQGHVVII